MRIAIVRYGKTLGTRSRAREVLADIEGRLRRQPFALVDLRDVLVFSHSFGDECFAELVDRARQGRYGKGTIVMFVGANEFVAETLDRVLSDRGLVSVLVNGRGAKLVGAVPKSDRETFEVIRSKRGVTTSDIADRLRVSQQAVNNRLARLLQAGVVTREPAGQGSGRPFLYRSRIGSARSRGRDLVAT